MFHTIFTSMYFKVKGNNNYFRFNFPNFCKKNHTYFLSLFPILFGDDIKSRDQIIIRCHIIKCRLIKEIFLFL